jgi:carbon monoxide dehydrogenase subunit G
MNLEHSFTVPVGIDEAWKILLDIERIGPCMPGAAIETVDGDDFTGTVKVKLGPIMLTYKGKASFVEKDEAAHRAVIDARGRDARGNGTAAAKITAELSEAGGATTVHVRTDLDITGKPAQFGRGVMVDVGNKLIGQFADSLAKLISGDSPADAAPAQAPASAPAKTTAAKSAPAKKTTAAAKKTAAAAKSTAGTASAPTSDAAPRKRPPSPPRPPWTNRPRSKTPPPTSQKRPTPRRPPRQRT